MEFTGKIMAALPRVSGISQKGNKWAKQEFVISGEGEKPTSMVFEVFGEDKLNEFNLQVGDQVKVAFSINATEYKDRWYNHLQAYAVERVEGEQKGNGVYYQKAKKQEVEMEIPEQDKLPF